MEPKITTYSKIHISVMEPKEEEILAEDIAHALSMMTRANGHYPEFYSVAQHSMDCYHEALARNYTKRVCVACLLHDASEAYLSDVSRPVKKNMTMYLQIEAQLQDLIYRKFLGNLPDESELELIKNVDDACLYYEFEHFMGERVMVLEPIMISSPNYQERVRSEVEQEFLRCFQNAMEEMEKEEKLLLAKEA